ncbi:peptidoglycan-binding domain-containing protein [Afifella marina]|uniref:Putative peptidoglycan binding domain-containing protein n=1 Tax=Afifella marina DSM 2698 TaxID=1120955 RepID=A0A1G5MGN2_AFIMA|nr:peptidoglycan-binding domain-containing protein [Afifella marina]SCZ23964.1 Putative peptidoglycan binding domain-containing protein [Afifella marina DSM 2698]
MARTTSRATGERRKRQARGDKTASTKPAATKATSALGERTRLGFLLRHAPAAALGLLAVAAIVNALVLQHGRHPDPLFATRDTGPAPTLEAGEKGDLEMIIRTGLVVPRERPQAAVAQGAGSSQEASAASSSEASAPGSAPDPVVFAVQQALADTAYGPVTADGLKGHETTEALRRFQLDQGLQVNGEIDRETLDRLAAIGAMPDNP